MTNAKDPLATWDGSLLADQYRMGRLIGAGGSGYVYEAEQVPLGRTVAVKLLRADRIDIERFRAEAQTASRINHPNAVAIYDFGVSEEGTPYLVMERVRGCTLGQVLDRGALPAERACAIAQQVLDAIDEAHACDVVHRDLKPDNVLIHRRAGRDRVKVIDFGLARLGNADVNETAIAGTPGYMAPEQITGRGIGPASDLYAVGVLLYEMITGHPPFSGGSLSSVLERTLRQAPVAPRELTPGCPEVLSQLILAALQKSPDARPATAEAMRAALIAGQDCRHCGAARARSGQFCVACGTPFEAPGQGPTSIEPPRSAPPISGAAPGAAPAIEPRTCVVGRESTIAQLAALMAGDDTHGAIALVGPAGAGKARIIAEAAGRACDLATVIIAGPDPSGLRDAWYPILSVLEAALGISGRVSYQELLQAVSRVGLPLRDAPGLAELFCVPGPLEGVELAVRRRETLTAARRALAALGNGQLHTTVCFTDVDRYDAPSLAVITAALSASSGAGVGLVLTATSQAMVPKAARIIEVGALQPGESYQLAQAITSAGAQLLPSMEKVHALTDGLPGRIEQLVACLAEGVDLGQSPSLPDLVSERINGLGPEQRRALQAIAVFGEEATDFAVRSVLSELGGRGEGLRGLNGRGLATCTDERWIVASSLIASVALASAPASVRRRLHGCALQLLRQARGWVPARILSHHADAAGDGELAFPALMASGEEAIRRFDDAGAVACFRLAVTGARKLSANGAPGAEQRFVRASVKLAETLRFTGETGLAAGVLQEASSFATDVLDRATVLRTRARVAVARGLYSVAGELFREAIGLGLKLGNREFLCETYVDLAGLLVQRGEPVAAVRELAEGIDVVTLWEGLEVSHGLRRLWLLGFRLAQLQLAAGNLEHAESTALGALGQAGDPSAPQARARIYALLAEIAGARGYRRKEIGYRSRAIEGLRAVGDRQSTAELLMANAHASRELPLAADRQSSEELTQLALQLASEVSRDPFVQSPSPHRP